MNNELIQEEYVEKIKLFKQKLKEEVKKLKR